MYQNSYGDPEGGNGGTVLRDRFNLSRGPLLIKRIKKGPITGAWSVELRGLEPGTDRLWADCSNQLSYSSILYKYRGIDIHQFKKALALKAKAESRDSDSNRRPTDYKSVALPTELYRHNSPSRTRTNDTAVNSRVLYRLSYGGIAAPRREQIIYIVPWKLYTVHIFIL